MLQFLTLDRQAIVIRKKSRMIGDKADSPTKHVAHTIPVELPSCVRWMRSDFAERFVVGQGSAGP